MTETGQHRVMGENPPGPLHDPNLTRGERDVELPPHNADTETKGIHHHIADAWMFFVKAFSELQQGSPTLYILLLVALAVGTVVVISLITMIYIQMYRQDRTPKVMALNKKWLITVLVSLYILLALLLFFDAVAITNMFTAK